MFFLRFLFLLKKKGFSLIETAIAIFIFSILSISVINLLKITLRYHELQIINSNQKIAKNALLLFFKENNRLPMPSNDQSGVENKPHYKKTNEKIAVGYVPYKTLGINYDESSDQSGKLLTYAVHSCDCVDLSPDLPDEFEPSIDIETLKFYSKSRLILENKNTLTQSDISFAVTAKPETIKKNGTDIIITKNAQTIAMSRKAIEQYQN